MTGVCLGGNHGIYIYIYISSCLSIWGLEVPMKETWDLDLFFLVSFYLHVSDSVAVSADVRLFYGIRTKLFVFTHCGSPKLMLAR